MPELDEKIARWRAAWPKALADESTRDELEEHLREEVAALCRKGLNLDAAFEAAVHRLGEPAAIAAEFERLAAQRPSSSRFILAEPAFTWVLVTAMIGFFTWAYFQGRITTLLFAHVTTLTAGCLFVLGNGLLGLWALIVSSSRTLRVTEEQHVRRAMLTFSVTASVLVSVGVAFGAAWAEQNLGHAWSWQPVEKAALLVLASTWLLLLAQARARTSTRTCALLATLGGIAGILGFATRGVSPIVPVGWICVALFMIEGAIVAFSRGDGLETEKAS